MSEKRFKMKKLGYEDYFIDSQQEYVDEDESNFEIDGEKTLSDSQILDLLNENEQLKKENKEIKQLIHTMLVQIDVEKINTENARYSARIIFTSKEFEKMRQIWKGDFE